jgi:hypothetical protein
MMLPSPVTKTVERPFKAAMPAFERAFFSCSEEPAVVHAVPAHP